MYVQSELVASKAGLKQQKHPGQHPSIPDRELVTSLGNAVIVKVK